MSKMEEPKTWIKRCVPAWILLITIVVTGICSCFMGIFVGTPSKSGKATLVAEALSLTVTIERSQNLAHTETISYTSTANITNTQTFTPTATPKLTNTPLFTITSEPPTSTPTNTQVPSSTPTRTNTPTHTPLPVAPTCSEILSTKNTMTDVQWDNYKDSLCGLWVVDWQARIRDVGERSWLAGGYPIHIDVSNDCSIYFVVSDEETALSYSKGQQITISGQIDFLSEFFGSITLHMEDITVEIE